MVVKLMRWPSWPPFSVKKFEVLIFLQRLQGLDYLALQDLTGLVVETMWKKRPQKGSRATAGRSSAQERVNCSAVGAVSDDGSLVVWNEAFQGFGTFSGIRKDGPYHPWEVAFSVFKKGENQGHLNRVLIGTASLNLSEYASTSNGKEIPVQIPLEVPGGCNGSTPLLSLSLTLLQLRTSQKISMTVQSSIVPVTLSPPSSVALSAEKDSISSALDIGKIFKHCVSIGRSKDFYDSDDEVGDHSYPLDMDSTDDADDDGEGDGDGDGDGDREEESKENSSTRQQPFCYETLALANRAGESLYTNSMICSSSSEDDFWGNYGNLNASVSKQSTEQIRKRKILSWKKRKLSFRGPKTQEEPLLGKHCGEQGGDDIDFCRRLLNPSHDSNTREQKLESSPELMFGDDDKFSVGSWEQKEIKSRDRQLKLQTKVFFASIDQRSERAAGESACTALVAVISDWSQSNRDEMPNKSEFDSLIRDGSSEWRSLCEKTDYIERFSDKHFDLDTIIEAKIRPLSLATEKSFVGFFHPEGIEDEADFDFLKGAMSFDSIWDEMSRFGSDCSESGDPLVYIVSWNDHFFVLKVEKDAYYIIDTLGERLYEGCNQAYILKFDKDTVIHRLQNENKASDKKSVNEEEEEVVCRGKESCNEYIKKFLAAIPLRELEADMKKGLMASTPLHHRLQIEFHCTKFVKPVDEISARYSPVGESSASQIEQVVTETD